MTAPILRQLGELRSLVSQWKRENQRVGVVPTMGALHAGHLSLIETAEAQCDRVIVTIFVNPKQFNNPEDLANYPRTEHDDAVKMAPFNVDVIYVPDGPQMYPEGFATTVSVEGLTDVLCGAHRPGHFDGVATVVTKLFLQTGADAAFFGEKDFQQLQVVRRMATDLDIPIELVGCPTVREADGLAMSSRNLRLSAAARSNAALLYQNMQEVTRGLQNGQLWKDVQHDTIKRLESKGFAEVEYLDLRAAATLAPLSQTEPGARLFAAAWLDGVRLIDNIDAFEKTDPMDAPFVPA